MRTDRVNSIIFFICKKSARIPVARIRVKPIAYGAHLHADFVFCCLCRFNVHCKYKAKDFHAAAECHENKLYDAIQLFLFNLYAIYLIAHSR